MRSRSDRTERWFTSIYATHYPDLVRYGVRRLADPEASAELAQEVFVVAWRRRDQVPDRSLPWLYGVACRLLANQWRARRARPVPVPVADPEVVSRPSPGAGGPEAAVALADQPGYVWRGAVTDRAGRAGVAISYDDTAHGQRSVLVFDSRTGQLLAHELVELAPEPRLLSYTVLDAGRTDQRPAVSAPAAPSPRA